MIGTICREIIKAGALEIRNLDTGQEPFLYSSGNWGPGYVMIKGLVSRPQLINWLCETLGGKVMSVTGGPDLVAGNVTGGVVPGWILSQYMKVPFVYVRDSRKKGGQKERVTGLYPGLSGSCLVVEELVNFAQTTVNSAGVLRALDFTVIHAATILSYDNPEAKLDLEAAGVQLISLITLGDLLAEAKRQELFPVAAIEDYQRFLADPLAWQKARGLEPVKDGGTK